MELNLIAAVTPCLGIAYQGSMPWHLPGDLKHFKKITLKSEKPKKRNAVLMGRKTWYALNSNLRPLPGRLNVVLSRNFEIAESADVKCCRSLHEALELISRDTGIDKVFVIGGASLYEQCINMETCQRLYLTELSQDFQCDTFFPTFDRELFKEIRLEELDETVQRQGDLEYRFKCYQRTPRLKEWLKRLLL